MCESSVWLRFLDGRTEKIADDVLIARQDGPAVVLQGLLAAPRRVAALIQEVNSLTHKMALLTTEPPDAGAPAPPAAEQAKP